jgi:hypothetical protein
MVALVAQVPDETHWEWRQGLCEHCRGTSELKQLRVALEATWFTSYVTCVLLL